MEFILAKLKVLMQNKGITIFKLTELAGLSENTIYNWYNKGAEPSIHALRAVCQILGVTLAQLFCENEVDNITFQENELISIFRHLSDGKKDVILKLIKELEVN